MTPHQEGGELLGAHVDFDRRCELPKDADGHRYKEWVNGDGDGEDDADW